MTYFEKHIEVSNQPSPNDTKETKPRNLQTKPKFNKKVRYKRKTTSFSASNKTGSPNTHTRQKPWSSTTGHRSGSNVLNSKKHVKDRFDTKSY